MAAQESTATATGMSGVQPAGEGEALWFNNDLLTLKATGAETDGRLLAVEELSRQGKVTPLHTHPAETESFYVLEGEGRFHVAGDEVRLGPGGFVTIPPGVPHAYLVTSETARMLILITPGDGAMEAFFRDAGEPARERVLPDAGPLDIERIGAAAARNGGGRDPGAAAVLPPGLDRAYGSGSTKQQLVLRRLEADRSRRLRAEPGEGEGAGARRHQLDEELARGEAGAVAVEVEGHAAEDRRGPADRRRRGRSASRARGGRGARAGRSSRGRRRGTGRPGAASRWSRGRPARRRRGPRPGRGGAARRSASARPPASCPARAPAR